MSTDPDEWEGRTISAIAMEPHVATCYLLWECPQQNVDLSRHDMQSWLDHAVKGPSHRRNTSQEIKCVDVRFLAPTETGSSDNVFSELNAACAEARETGDLRNAEIEKRVLDGVGEMLGELRAMHRNLMSNQGMTPWAFQRWFAGDMRVAFDTQVGQIRNSPPQNFQTPERILLESEFLTRIAERFAEDDSKRAEDRRYALSVNELECRNFLFQLLLGQTMDWAKRTATDVYENLMIKFFDQVGNKFNKGGKAFLQELADFCDKKPPQTRHSTKEADAKEKEMDVQRQLRNFLEKSSFVSMYVGCVLSEVVPILYCTVAPQILQEDQKDVTAEHYIQHLTTARSVLQ